MTEQEKRQEAFDQQIASLLQKATERPGPNDPLGMVGFFSALLAGGMFVKSEERKMNRREEGKGTGDKNESHL